MLRLIFEKYKLPKFLWLLIVIFIILLIYSFRYFNVSNELLDKQTKTKLTQPKLTSTIDYLSQIKNCELFFDDDTKTFTYKFSQLIKTDDKFEGMTFIRKGKEEEYRSWMALLRKADKEGRTKEVQSILDIVNESSIEVFYKKEFSREYVQVFYNGINSEDLCEAKQIIALNDYANSNWILEISKNERVDIFNKYISTNLAYISANKETKDAIKTRYKVND